MEKETVNVISEGRHYSGLSLSLVLRCLLCTEYSVQNSRSSSCYYTLAIMTVQPSESWFTSGKLGYRVQSTYYNINGDLILDSTSQSPRSAMSAMSGSPIHCSGYGNELFELPASLDRTQRIEAWVLGGTLRRRAMPLSTNCCARGLVFG